MSLEQIFSIECRMNSLPGISMDQNVHAMVYRYHHIHKTHTETLPKQVNKRNNSNSRLLGEPCTTYESHSDTANQRTAGAGYKGSKAKYK